tara:strand:+ start:2897 stop:3343 length:447 start_codon:yes stop_codon:yes gene_type:complete
MIKLKSLLTESMFNFEPDASSLKTAMQPSKLNGNQPPIDSLLADWLYTDSTNNMAAKYKFVKSNIGKLHPLLKNWSHFNNTNLTLPNFMLWHKKDTNKGVYEAYFNLFAAAIKKAGKGNLTYKEIQRSTKSKSNHKLGSEESIGLFGI